MLDVLSAAHGVTRPTISRLFKVFTGYIDVFCRLGLNLRNGTVTFYIWLENRVRLHLLQFFMLVEGFLESGTFLHDLFVFNRDHAIVHVGCHVWIFLLLLVIKARIGRSEWILLISLTYLEAKSSHFVLHELVVKVAARTRVLSDLLWNTIEKLTFYRW